jgi:signal transduction histidine kinase
MWNDLDRWLVNPSGLTPHGFCLLWEPGLIWTYALSDIGIGVAYSTIPLALAVFVRRRRDLVFRPLFWLFAAFIMLCGLSHWLDVLTLWVPAYGLEAIVKALTASVSLVTAVGLWWLMPRALALPSPAQLREANEALRESQSRLHQAQKMEAVGQLTGGIAHDFNNMLQVIGGGMHLMERRISQGRAEDIPRYADSMRQALDRASALTHRLLAFSRRQTLRLQAVKPSSLVRGMEELMRRTLGPAIRLEPLLDVNAWHAMSDANQLETALLNLAINARDAMPGGGTLRIATADQSITANDLSGRDEAEPGDYVEIAVTDTGIGMPPDILARVFEPFFTTKPIGQGTGLGLSQVYGFIRQSGGFVHVESEAGKGTTVRLYLPRDINDVEAAPDPGVTATTAPGSKVLRATILVVEDEAEIRGQIVGALREAGCEVLEAEDGRSGLALARSTGSIGLLITDVGLPGMNGRQLADAARADRPGLPVLFITGYAGDAMGDARLPAGMEILHKPFDIDRLIAQAGAMLKETLAH